MAAKRGKKMSGIASFNRFYETWMDHLHHLVQQLRKAPKPPGTDDDSSQLGHLVQKLMFHHAEFFRVKSAAAERDVLSVFTASWASSLERSLHWIAGWRPTTLFHLVYTEASILFEFHIADILRGQRTGDLGDLSPTQFRQLQCETVKEENAITEELSEWQDGASEIMAGSSADVREKMGRLASVLKKADDLRMRTLRRLAELLTPQQAAEFFIAAAELQFGVRDWGKKQDQHALENA
ncbi:hypothetical protein Tsubulata_032291 [Turnera subulata]|uniref:DOG1 domain-containing protein n=1 Tax=Turnera subulata TaxID=218843 RepID=A0A9Q0F780_9ROSI|nr:hypothetical protein Tsubulata_032291 [Turnera subulata]